MSRRISVPDLLPDTDYALRVRIKNGDAVSDWSPVINLTTITDDVLPYTPDDVTWVASGDSFHAEWSTVTNNVDGDTIPITRYEVSLNNETAILSVPQVLDGLVTFDLSFEQNRVLLGIDPSVILKVRSVDNKELKSAWSTPITATNPAPGPVTGLDAVGGTGIIDVSWTAPADTDIVRYDAYIGSTKIWQGDATRFTFNTITYTSQTITVKAIDKFGQESTGVSDSATAASPFVVDTTAPAVPTGLTATQTNYSSGLAAWADVSWTAVADSDLAGYVVRWRRSGSSDAWTQHTSDTNNSVRVELAIPYQNYAFNVRSFDSSANYSGWSSTYTGTGGTNAAPANVTGLTATPGRDSIVYSWTGVADTDIRNYEVTFSTSSTFASGNITYLTGTSTTLTVAGLNPGTTYYARVRAVDTGGLTSAAWSSTNTTATTTFPLSDGSAPASSPTPSVLGGLSYLYVTWTGVTNADIVTYEVHLSTTTGFTPSAGTKVTEVTGTSAIIDVLPGTTTPLSYNTTYYVKLIAKDRDGSAAAGSQGSGQISKVASTDVTSIGADLIVPGTGFVSALVVNTGGSIQSSNYSAGSAGWRIAPTGAEYNDSGSSIKADAIKAGTLGGSGGSGVINIAAGTSLIFNGGYLKSNTYTGTTQASNPSGAGFYLGNDGIRIDQGIVSASALTAGTISGTNTITLSGANAKIVGTGFELSGSGLTVTSGSVAASALQIQTGANLMPPQYANFDLTSSFYTSEMTSVSNATLSTTTTAPKFGTQSLTITRGASTAGWYAYFSTSGTNYNVPVDPGTSYIVSCYVRNRSAVSTTFQLGADWSSGGNASGGYITPTVSSNTWTRYVWSMTTPAGCTGISVFAQSNTTTSGNQVDIAGLQVEAKVGGLNTPGTWNPPGVTSINGNIIKTGAIISTSNTGIGGTPLWSIPMNGSATFQNLLVRGNSVVGASGDGTSSLLASYNYVAATSGWKIDAAGNAEFNNATMRGLIYANGGEVSGDLKVSGSIVAGGSTTSGERILMRADGSGGIIEAYSGVTGETPGKIDPSSNAGRPSLLISTGTTATYNLAGSILLISDASGVGGSVATINATAIDLEAFEVFLGNGTSTVTVVNDLDVSGHITAGGTGWQYVGIAVPFATNWYNIGFGWRGARYRRIGNDVEIQGLVYKLGAGGTTVFTLPTGYRPTESLMWMSTEGGAAKELRVESNGNVSFWSTVTDGTSYHKSVNCRFSID